jgi:hypothetical protein
MAAIETTLARAGGRAAAYIGKIAIDKVRRRALLDSAEALAGRAPLTSFIAALTPTQGSAFLDFVNSPQFEHLALQTTIWHLAGRSEDDLADIRHTVRLSLRPRLNLPDDQLLTATDLVLHLLTTTAEAAAREHRDIKTGFAVGVVADLAAANARRHELLERLSDLKTVDKFAKLLRSQVAALRAKMRLAHLGRRAGVEYVDLHVDPVFHFPEEDESRSAGEAIEQYQRVVILGDPGAGKSTFAAKLAHDLADDALLGMEGRVPFLVVAREHAEALRTTRRPLSALLEDVAKAPYNVTPSVDDLEYLLLSGTAFVIIDGIDELGGTEARRRLAELVEAFAHHYPLVNIVITSRVVGYDEAALDRDLFPDIRIAPFTDEQVSDYARRWFTLEEDRDLAGSFLTESEGIPDLRSNPLVLSLLCSLYETKHYIPVNRTQIYENCAELLFERWDQSREMSVPMRFGTHLRPAVARLAWLMFTDPSGSQVFTRRQAVALLVEYMLEERFDDWNSAASAANEFLDYCAGRAWLLTEMGVSGGERVYGFTHRTFLEYFTAVHMVRQGPSPQQVWDQLRDRVPDASWNTVAHLAINRLDRDCAGGASGFLELMLDASATDASHRATYLGFGAEIADEIGLRTPTLRRLARECVQLAGGVSCDARYRHTWTATQIEASRVADGPLVNVLAVSLPENVSRLGVGVMAAFRDLGFMEVDEATSFGLLSGMLLRLDEHADPGSVAQHVVHEAGLVDFSLAKKWAARLEWATAEDVQRHGPGFLFKTAGFGDYVVSSCATRLVTDALVETGKPPISEGVLESLYQPLIEAPWPWILAVDDLGVDGYVALTNIDIIDGPDEKRFVALNQVQRSTVILLLIVLKRFSYGPNVDLFVNLHAAREGGDVDVALEQVRRWDLLPEAHDLVVKWIKNEASPVVLDKYPPGRPGREQEHGHVQSVPAGEAGHSGRGDGGAPT